MFNIINKNKKLLSVNLIQLTQEKNVNKNKIKDFNSKDNIIKYVSHCQEVESLQRALLFYSELSSTARGKCY